MVVDDINWLVRVYEGAFEGDVHAGSDGPDELLLRLVREEQVVIKVPCRVKAFAGAAAHVLRPACPDILTDS